MRILYFGGESANFVIETCNALCRQGHKVTAVVQQLDEYDKDNPVLEHENLSRINVDYATMFNPIRMKNRLIAEFARKKFDLIFGSHAPITPVLHDLARTYGLPWGVMLLDIPTHTMRTQRWRMKQWNYWFQFLRQADIVVFNNTIARDEFYAYTRNWIPDDHIIHYGTFRPKEYREAGITIRGDYVLSICRLHPIKNCKVIPMALNLLNSDLKYMAVGRDAGELEFIKNYCKKNNISFEWRGIVTEKEKWELIKNCSMFIYPQDTKYIGGQACLEAMWAGKPVLASDYGVLRELYGNAAFYFDPKNIENLAEKIAFVKAAKIKTLEPFLREGVEQSEKIGSYDKMGELLSNLFKKYLKKE